jgi:hypothetical protein
MQYDEIKKEFEAAQAKYRSLPFWGWNGILDTDEIRRQIQSMKQQGIGGFFIHSRDGLETEYMGEQWNRCVEAAVDEAAGLGMQVWLYDEDRWPSGTAGGSVPAKYGDDSRCKGVTLEICGRNDDSYITDKAVIAVYRAQIDGMKAFSVVRLHPGEQIELTKDEKLLVVRMEVSGKSEWFNNEAPPDNMNPESVRHFIESTHEKYRSLIGNEFGKTVQGIFTDEPSLADRHAAFPPNRGWIPWTDAFAGYFFEKRGYDVFDTLPYIYFDGDKSPKARHDYWRTVSQRYAESYSKVIGQWCGENGIAYTGHFLQEDKLGLCARVNGSIMPHYQYQQVPGIDMLCEQTDEYMTVKQCSSVAHQFGKPVVISETYGCTGWEFTFEDQKWIGDWQYVLGVNRRCQHLALYSIKGCRKRDYPPSFNYNTTWWNNNYMVEDYFARLSSVLTQGEVIRDVLVIHPMSTAWSRLGTSPYGNPVRRNERDVPAIDDYGYEFNGLLKYISGMHYDADLGDETIIANEACVRNSCFGIKNAVYRAVLLPSLDSMLRSTFTMLLEAMDHNVGVIAIAPVPTMIEGEKSREISRIFEHSSCTVVSNRKEAVVQLERILSRRVSITDDLGCEDESLLYMFRDLGGVYALFAVNNDRDKMHFVTIRISQPGAVEEWNPLTGQKISRSVCVDKDGIYFQEQFEQAGSKLYIIHPSKPIWMNENIMDNHKFPRAKPDFIFPARCKVRRNMPNTLTLDTCRYSLNGEKWSDSMPVWEMQRHVRDRLSMLPIDHNGLLQRYKWVHTPHKNDGQLLRIRFSYEVLDNPETDVYLVLEEAEHFTVLCNGIPVNEPADGWFLDRSFQTVKLPGLKEGINSLELSCAYLNSMEIEDCYLAGDFNVDCERRIRQATEELSIGDWTSQGYFHYAGSITYIYSYCHDASAGLRVKLKLEDFSATCVRVSVNGKIYDVPWKAEAVQDITDSLLPGENAIEIEVTGSPRNMLGPFHLAGGKDQVTNDSSFRPQGRDYTGSYNLHPYGLMHPPKIFLEQI